MTVKENIRRLLKLHMVRNKINTIISGIFIMVFVLVQFIIAIKSIAEQTNFEVEFFQNMSLPFFVLYAWAILSGMDGYTMLCDDGISMYPGTIKSRFAARLIWDHISILILLCVSVIAYFVQGALILLLSKVFDGAMIGSALDIQYLLWGVFRTFGFALLAYSVFTLWYVLIVRFPWIAYVAIGVAVFFGVFSMSNTNNAMEVMRKFAKIYILYTGKGEYPAYTGILVCIATWAVFLLAAWLIGSRAKLWKRQKNSTLWVTMAFMYCAFCLTVSSSFLAQMDEMSPDDMVSPNMENVVSKSLDVSGIPKECLWSSIEEGGPLVIVRSREDKQQGADPEAETHMIITTMLQSESEAREMNIPVPEGVVDEDHVYMMAWSVDSLYKEKDLLKPFLEEYIETVSLQYEQAEKDEGFDEYEGGNVKFLAEAKPYICLVNGMYGDMHKFLKDTTYCFTGIGDMLEDSIIQMVVYSDALAEPPEEN